MNGMTDNTTANREFKDTVFKLLFGQREAAISACNSILGTNYGADTRLKITDIRKVFTNRKTNDLALVFEDRLIVFCLSTSQR